MRFYLGTHRANWLDLVDVPLFVSHRVLRERKSLPLADGPWCLDSGGFTELTLHGRWTTSMEHYIGAVERYAEDIGRLEWAAPMDWMCEPVMIEKTGLSVREHQQRTVENFCELRQRAPHLPFIPVLQGWTLEDYEHCLTMYDEAGVDLLAESTIGVGSVCRRQYSDEIGQIMCMLHEACGLRLHGFGVKKLGLRKYGQYLKSADSMAWSFRARNAPPLPGCTHKNCANCLRFALKWRGELLTSLEGAT